jgi:hypothetical protein
MLLFVLYGESQMKYKGSGMRVTPLPVAPRAGAHVLAGEGRVLAAHRRALRAQRGCGVSAVCAPGLASAAESPGCENCVAAVWGARWSKAAAGRPGEERSAPHSQYPECPFAMSSCSGFGWWVQGLMWRELVQMGVGGGGQAGGPLLAWRAVAVIGKEDHSSVARRSKGGHERHWNNPVGRYLIPR